MDTRNLLEEWVSDWYCYWDGSFGIPASPEINYVFKPALSLNADDFVRFNEGIPTVEAEERRAKDIISELKKCIDDKRILCSCFGSESDYPYYKFLNPWDSGKALSPETFLESIGAHSELISEISFDPLTAQDQKDAVYNEQGSFVFGSMTSHIFEKLIAESSEMPLIFYSGSEKLNPVPFFIVCRFSPTIVGGFMSAVVHT
jgi:hypothetical protein